MKRGIVTVSLMVLGLMALSVVAFAKATAPEIDPAAATFSVQYTANPTQTTCSGEDSGNYAKTVSKLAGTSTESSSGGDFSLDGTVKIKSTTTTNVTTGLGVSDARITLLPSSAAKDRSRSSTAASGARPVMAATAVPTASPAPPSSVRAAWASAAASR